MISLCKPPLYAALSLVFSVTLFAQERTDFANTSADILAESSPVERRSSVGVIYPNQRFLLSMAASGIVDQVMVREGDFVNQGDILIVLDQTIEALEIERLTALVEDQRLLESTRRRLNLQRQQVQSVRQLYEATRSVSLDELNSLRMGQSALEGEIASLEVDRMRSQFDLKIAQALMAQRTLKAPSSGFITQIRPKTGEWAQFGEPVIELVDTSSNYIRIHVNDQKAASLSIDQAVPFSVEGVAFEGYISFISPVADPASGLVEVKVYFDNPDNRLRPGLKADVKL